MQKSPFTDSEKKIVGKKFWMKIEATPRAAIGMGSMHCHWSGTSFHLPVQTVVQKCHGTSECSKT